MINDALRLPDLRKRRKLLAALALVFCILFSAAACWFIGRPMIEFIEDPGQFRAWVDMHGLLGRLLYVGMVVVQIVIAMIPGEPLELVAGYAFGAFEGTILCMIGSFIGSVAVFLLVRRFGMQLVEVFFPREKLRQVKFLNDEKRLVPLLFVIFLIPGTPKDLLCYVAGLTPIRLSSWMIISAVARIPSIVTSTISGGAFGSQDYTLAIVVSAITILLSVAGLLIYRRISKRKENNQM